MTTIEDHHAHVAGPIPADQADTVASARAQIVHRLGTRFPGVSKTRIEIAIDRATDQLADARVTQYLAVLVERLARHELTQHGTGS